MVRDLNRGLFLNAAHIYFLTRVNLMQEAKMSTRMVKQKHPNSLVDKRVTLCAVT
jgi:hypothetical protein